jgi:hypothetical protein
MAWRFCRPRHELNFLGVETIHEAEFLVLLFHVMSRVEELQMRWEYLRLHTPEAEESMAQIRTAHPEYVQAELDFRAEKDEKKKVAAASAPSTSRGEARHQRRVFK